MAEGFALVVVTPERQLVEMTAAQALVLRTADGDMTVLDGHTSLIAAVVPGLVRVDQEEGESLRLAVHGGFLQVDTGPLEEAEGSSASSTRVTLLAGIAELSDEIDVERARRAKEAAEARGAERRPAGAEGAEVEAAETSEETLAAQELARAELRLEVAGATG